MEINSVKRIYRIFIILYALFIMYMMLIGFGRSSGEARDLQLIPFQTISKFFSGDVSFYNFFINIICNIFLFIPFGFIGLILKPFESLRFLLPVFISGIVFMEFLQTVTGRGFGEIDDVILNTTGMLAGYFNFRFLKYQKLTKSIFINSR